MCFLWGKTSLWEAICPSTALLTVLATSAMASGGNLVIWAMPSYTTTRLGRCTAYRNPLSRAHSSRTLSSTFKLLQKQKRCTDLISFTCFCWIILSKTTAAQNNVSQGCPYPNPWVCGNANLQGNRNFPRVIKLRILSRWRPSWVLYYGPSYYSSRPEGRHGEQRELQTLQCTTDSANADTGLEPRNECVLWRLKRKRVFSPKFPERSLLADTVTIMP